MIRITYKLVTAIIVSLVFFGVVKAENNIIFEDNFDRADPWGGWVSDNGVWDVGTPTSGPETCHSGSNCAATVLDGNYPSSVSVQRRHLNHINRIRYPHAFSWG